MSNYEQLADVQKKMISQLEEIVDSKYKPSSAQEDRHLLCNDIKTLTEALINAPRGQIGFKGEK